MSDHIICSVFCPVDVILGFSFKFIKFIYHMNLCLLCLKVYNIVLFIASKLVFSIVVSLSE